MTELFGESFAALSSKNRKVRLTTEEEEIMKKPCTTYHHCRRTTNRYNYPPFD
jgi:hypothetical protein